MLHFTNRCATILLYLIAIKEIIMKNQCSDCYNCVNKNSILEVENIKDTTRLSAFGRALSSPVRIQMIRLVNKRNMLASEIATELGLPLSSTIFHLKILEEAKLVERIHSTKQKGTLHWYTYGLPKKTIVYLREIDGNKLQRNHLPYTHSVNIGDYIEAEFAAFCGIATERDHIMENSPHQAFLSGRHNAQIIWSNGYGSLSYAFPNDFTLNGNLSEISFSLEICSEARGFNSDYPSDITFSVNDIEVCIFTSPGDYGDRYGKFTPPWWYPESTKYGLLTNISIRDRGVFLNEKLVNKTIGLADLNLSNGHKMTFKLEVKKDAQHAGGFNIFGDKFGDYAQHINFTATYK
jgi:predicted transcriptional regulator